MPGSAIYLGKQNRVLCRAALVSKKHPSDEDGRLCPSRIRFAPFFFGMQKKAGPSSCKATREKIPHILDSTLPFFVAGEIQVMHSKFQPFKEQL